MYCSTSLHLLTISPSVSFPTDGMMMTKPPTSLWSTSETRVSSESSFIMTRAV